MLRSKSPRIFIAAVTTISFLSNFNIASASEATIRIVFPFAAGGSGDALARLIGERVQTSLSRKVIVENRTGSSGLIGVLSVKNAAPDGATILMTPIAPMAIFPHTYKALDYDPVSDFEPISQAVIFDYGLAVSPSVPANTPSELVAWLKANPEKATYGSPGVGALPQFTGILLGQNAGIEFTHVPYKGSAPALADLMGGHISTVVLPTSDLIELNKAGKIRIIATSGTQRSPLLPAVPTFLESGINITTTGWYGFYVPAKTPEYVVKTLHNVIAGTVAAPEVRQRLLGYGFLPTGTTPTELLSIQKADSDKWGPIIKASGFVAE